MTLTESALKANPGSAKLWYNRGIMRMEAGDTDGGLADLQKATLLWKDYSDALMALSTHYYTSGDVRPSRPCPLPSPVVPHCSHAPCLPPAARQGVQVRAGHHGDGTAGG